jgi:hypothetical protein
MILNHRCGVFEAIGGSGDLKIYKCEQAM